MQFIIAEHFHAAKTKTIIQAVVDFGIRRAISSEIVLQKVFSE